MTRTVGLGVLGYGLIAAAHAGALRQVNGAALNAVCGPRQAAVEDYGARFGVPFATTDLDAFLARPDVEAVLVDTPDDLHADLTLRALAAGKHVLCEKPLAQTVEECRVLVDAAARTPVLTMVGFSNRRFPWAQELKRLLEAGALGRVFHVQAQSLSASMLRPDARQRWRSDPKRAPLGVLGDLGSHSVDLVRYLFGEIAEVCGDVRSLSGADVSNDDVEVLFRIVDGLHGTLAFSRLSVVDRHYGPGRRQFLVSGEQGAFSFENGVASFVPRDGETRPIPLPASVAAHEGYLAGATEPTVRTFVEAVRSGIAPSPTFVDGLRCAEVLDAVMRSSAERRWVSVPAASR